MSYHKNKFENKYQIFLFSHQVDFKVSLLLPADLQNFMNKIQIGLFISFNRYVNIKH